MNTTAAARKIKLNRVATGYYCFQDFNRGHSFDIIQNDLGMWGIQHTDFSEDEDKQDAITARTLTDVRAYINAKVYA